MLGKGLESLIPPQQSLNVGTGQAPRQSISAVRQDAQIQTPVQSALPKEENVRELGREKSPRVSMRRGFEGDAIFHIEIDKIKPNPHQPRREFNEDGLRDLANSIREFGILQPLVVSKVEREVPTGTEVEYELIAGERRLRAAKLIGLPRVPVVIKKIEAPKERLEMAVIENIQRENLNPIEAARAFARLYEEFHLTQREIAARLGKSREAVTNTIRLLNLPSYIQDAIAKGRVSESHGLLLLSIGDRSGQEKIFRDMLDHHIPTRVLRIRIAEMDPRKKPEPAVPPAQSELAPELKILQERLSSQLGAPVKIEQHGETGKIMITFYSDEELKNIVGKLGGEEEI